MPRFTPGDFDVFYISFDELNAEANWNRLKSQHADAKRVHGVIGFDLAHRVCAMSSTTKRFVTVDGDNWINDGTLSWILDDDDMPDVCFSFKSRNLINGLEYGNGGVKVWDRQTFLSSTTHERADTTDFCWDIRYFQVDHVGSTTVQNCTPYQAWRSGYREGVKMSYINGKPLANFARHWRDIWKGNLSRLCIWCTVGRDVENGIWAMLGARQGLFELASGAIRNTDINDYLWFSNKWMNVCDDDPDLLARLYAVKLKDAYGFMVPELDSDHSSWMKLVYQNPMRHGILK